ncbi:MAG: DUF2779 domain-containing protein [Candidatus Margulisiibacteriota bacterium]
MPKSNLFLSKTKYLEGLRCPKLLWLEYNRKDLIPRPDAATEHVFAEGRRVGEYAQKLFPDGLKIQRDFDPEKQDRKSKEALKHRKPLFEAGFIFGRAYALADILVPVEEDSWDLIEVKSSTSVKSEHYQDAAFQKYVYEGAGIKLRSCSIMYLNNQYVKVGPIEPDQLFAQKEITAEADNLKIGMEERIKNMIELISQKEMPGIKVGPQCRDIRDCILEDMCFEFLPEEDHILILYKGGKQKFELLERGIMKITDIPVEELEGRQLIQVESHKNKTIHINKEEIAEFLKKIKFPAYFLDFETIAPAIPVYDQSRPYLEIPFQYSLFVLDEENAVPRHFTYLAPGDVDPRPQVLKTLKELLGDKGSILAYNAGFEQRCIKNASEVYPEYIPWAEATNERFVDLIEPFKNFLYYNPVQEGSASLKRVLPAIAGSSYKGLKIAEGQTAAAEYYRVTFGENIDEADRRQVREALLKYCDLDTKGMIDIFYALKEAVK